MRNLNVIFSLGCQNPKPWRDTISRPMAPVASVATSTLNPDYDLRPQSFQDTASA
jgi:hypothetical protein